MKKPTQPTTDEMTDPVETSEESLTSELQTKIGELQLILAQSLEREKRVLADYQNLVRRSQEDRLRMAKLAASELALGILQPLDHLQLAADQLQDKGLNMVVVEFWQALKDQGLEEIAVLGQPFSVETMEVIDKKGEGDKVISVASRGYRLNGEVIRHAKVVLG